MLGAQGVDAWIMLLACAGSVSRSTTCRRWLRAALGVDAWHGALRTDLVDARAWAQTIRKELCVDTGRRHAAPEDYVNNSNPIGHMP